MIKAVGLSFLTVKNLSRAKDFFINTFGFELFEEKKEFGWCELKIKGAERSCLGICQSQEEPIFINDTDVSNPMINWKNKPGQNGVITLVVQDINRAQEAIKQEGLVCANMTELPGVFKMFTFFDFDQNKIECYQFIS
jgi:predicted enzyme related to lactoylglutathione lyase